MKRITKLCLFTSIQGAFYIFNENYTQYKNEGQISSCSPPMVVTHADRLISGPVPYRNVVELYLLVILLLGRVISLACEF